MTSEGTSKNTGFKEQVVQSDLLPSNVKGPNIPYTPHDKNDHEGLSDSSTAKKIKFDDKLGHRERLRKKVLTLGVESLADYELLEMLLFAASPRGDTKPLAKRLINEFGDLSGVMSASNETLKKIDGVGDAAIATIRISEKLGEKLLRGEFKEKNVLSSWQALQEYCQVVMGRKEVENFRILFLNNKNHLIADEIQQTGTVNHTAVYPREVVKRALELHASSLILVHNHPSGDTTPSRADIQMTGEIVKAADALNIKVHDHLIVSRNESTSLKSLGLM
ncbi:RadC family protein [Sneathiella sp. P13V-1]|uniref:RadC family protein n=1 Tax=Sneathiella sp. P13V-1 TaxID=2697366 RepID=UPI00187B89E4|nr:DNA repair protein RadC [Sneathiella sp. P13V-1]